MGRPVEREPEPMPDQILLTRQLRLAERIVRLTVGEQHEIALRKRDRIDRQLKESKSHE